MSKNNWRIGLTLVLVVAALFAFWHTFSLWTMSDAEKARMQEEQPGELLKLQQKAIRLGLDLQGGIHVVLRVDMAELAPAERDGAVDRAIAIIRNRVDGLGVAEPTIQKQGTDRIIVDLPGYTDANRAEELIGQTALLEFKLLETMDNAQLLLTKIDSAVFGYEKAKAGAAPETPGEPAPTAPTADSAAQEPDVMAELMGDSATKDTTEDPFAFDENTADAENEKPLSSRLSPALYSSQSGEGWPGFYVAKDQKERIDRWIGLPEVQALMPIDVQWAWSTRSEIRESREVYTLYLLKRKVQFLGRFLENIRLGQGQYGEYTVDFSLSGDGSARFAQLTGANIGKPLAIVLDNRVESAPIINSKIRTNGQITMGGGASIKDAQNLEIVLKAGALPAPVNIIEKNVVGATLGADSIRKGFYSALLGLCLVLLYMAVYYRISGLIADIGLLFNIFFLLAVMAGLSATLTMPGIAGIILTMGIAVDSNILIFERIREELRTGKTVRAAIEAGYDRAFVAIFDSHVTTLITAGALFLLGSGSIKGFAVTLFWGVAISLYTAYVVTKQIFDIRKSYRSLSI
ncbi:MAG TPA: protein translocase subunit SecD [candidate division Zixibacteria bacterium]|nr:protein translocase subunit SecD [candidate division Zixibacteria bacterium]MDD4916576.1 protein translocase subunit SecD [candidate division Zixibacteria bacterium]MDM7973742.1 protein translocase subunit SecD [candidate division Zixibacteria bacterium]HOD65763.1 protein translocase subunit SecD [candidate division Zixibacteria bacterium]HPC10680.1 protein translocase subunit SecD [candidate division Zixibacteria bacterium]